jgi:hypothetical protein
MDQHRSADLPPEVEPGEIARIVVKDRPEVAACLDGLVFRGLEDALIPLLRAALINMAAGALLDLEDEDSTPVCIPDLIIRTKRMSLAGKALDWELQARRNPPERVRQRLVRYQVEVQELLLGPPAPLELDRQEREVVLRKVKEALAAGGHTNDADADLRLEQLKTISNELDSQGSTGVLNVVGLTRASLAEWLAEWSDGAFDAAQADCGTPKSIDAEGSLLRDVQTRLLKPYAARSGIEGDPRRTDFRSQ